MKIHWTMPLRISWERSLKSKLISEVSIVGVQLLLLKVRAWCDMIRDVIGNRR